MQRLNSVFQAVDFKPIQAWILVTKLRTLSHSPAMSFFSDHRVICTAVHVYLELLDFEGIVHSENSILSPFTSTGLEHTKRAFILGSVIL